MTCKHKNEEIAKSLGIHGRLLVFLDVLPHKIRIIV